MFGFLKKGMLNRMNNYVTRIQIACAEKLLSRLHEGRDLDETKRLAAAVSNRLFGREPSALHSGISSELVNRQAISFLKEEDDEELRFGIVMSLRTRMVIETHAGNIAATKIIGETIQWLKSAISLPPETPNPNLMATLSSRLYARYTSSAPPPYSKAPADQPADPVASQQPQNDPLETRPIPKEARNRGWSIALVIASILVFAALFAIHTQTAPTGRARNNLRAVTPTAPVPRNTDAQALLNPANQIADLTPPIEEREQPKERQMGDLGGYDYSGRFQRDLKMASTENHSSPLSQIRMGDGYRLGVLDGQDYGARSWQMAYIWYTVAHMRGAKEAQHNMMQSALQLSEKDLKWCNSRADILYEEITQNWNEK